MSDVLPLQMLLYVLASIMLVLLGLYLAGVSSIAARFEKLGGAIWHRLRPLAGCFLPVRSAGNAFVVGAVLPAFPDSSCET